MTREIPLLIEPTKIITATLQLTPLQITANLPTDVKLDMVLKNSGNIHLEHEPLNIEIFNKDIGEVILSEEITVSIPLAEEVTETKTITLNLPEGNYETWLKHLEEIIALSDLTAISAIKPNVSISIIPRVFIMPLAPRQKFFIELLQASGIEYQMGQGVKDSYAKFHRGQANINILLGNELEKKLIDELKERIYHGEGLILLCDKPAKNPEWTEFLGVTIKPIPGKTRENIFHLLPNEFSSENEIECIEKIKLQMIKKHDDVIIIAQTQQKKYPVIIYHPYGKGHILAMTTPIQFKTGTNYMIQLLLNVISKFSQDIYTDSDLTRLLPIELSLKNKSPKEKSLKVKLLAPYGVEIFDYHPQPEENKELQWKITIPGKTTKTISYWAKLPDQINTFEITAELYDKENISDQVSISFDVSQVVLYHLNELILELATITASGKDAKLIKKASHHLEQLRSRPGDSFMVHLLNLHDSVKAAAYLGEIKNVDISDLRIKVQDIMLIMGRRFFENVETQNLASLQKIIRYFFKVKVHGTLAKYGVR